MVAERRRNAWSSQGLSRGCRQGKTNWRRSSSVGCGKQGDWWGCWAGGNSPSQGACWLSGWPELPGLAAGAQAEGVAVVAAGLAAAVVTAAAEVFAVVAAIAAAVEAER